MGMSGRMKALGHRARNLAVAASVVVLSSVPFIKACVLTSDLGGMGHIGHCSDQSASSLCSQASLGASAVCFCGDGSSYEAKITCDDRGSGPLFYQDSPCYPSGTAGTPSADLIPFGDMSSSCCGNVAVIDPVNVVSGRDGGNRDAGSRTDAGCRGATCNNDAGTGTQDAGHEPGDGGADAGSCASSCPPETRPSEVCDDGFSGFVVPVCNPDCTWSVDVSHCYLEPSEDGGVVVIPDAGSRTDAGCRGATCNNDAGHGTQDSGPSVADAGRDAGPVAISYCSDPDGLDLTVRGTTESGTIVDGIRVPNHTNTDSCASPISVREFSCSGSVIIEDILACPEAGQECEEGACMRRLPNPVLHLTFNESSGGIAYDQSGHNNNGVFDPMVVSWISDGKLGGAVRFGGQTNGITVRNAESLNPRDQITMAAWIYVTANNSPFNLFGNTAYPDGPGYFLGFVNGGPAEGISTESTRPYGYIFTSSTALLVWDHIAATYDSSTGMLRLYVNGTEAETFSAPEGSNPRQPLPDTMRPSPLDLIIGGMVPDVLNPFNGSLDDVRIYDITLSAEQIRILYNGGAGTEATRPRMP